MSEDGLEYNAPISATHYLFTAAFRVGHHAQYIAGLVYYPGNVVRGAIGIGLGCSFALRCAVPEGYLSPALQFPQGCLVDEEVTLAVRYRHL